MHEKQWLCLRKGHKPTPEAPADSFLGSLVITRGLYMFHSVATDSVKLFPQGKWLAFPPESEYVLTNWNFLGGLIWQMRTETIILSNEHWNYNNWVLSLDSQVVVSFPPHYLLLCYPFLLFFNLYISLRDIFILLYCCIFTDNKKWPFPLQSNGSKINLPYIPPLPPQHTHSTISVISL